MHGLTLAQKHTAKDRQTFGKAIHDERKSVEQRGKNKSREMTED
jgi:hypothetical protein